MAYIAELSAPGISIHAPARGATYIFRDTEVYTGISIHAPARGATEATKIKKAAQLYFNPRTREGCDV